ncbi:MAG: hypothetical protein A2Y76_00270 [Planctomycetes bacterium RBG_13_60_9]|nr:MAG: hypothetical protein A2Y76_00270 [Planctomycetes bacterium RBG_13_60_9]
MAQQSAVGLEFAGPAVGQSHLLVADDRVRVPKPLFLLEPMPVSHASTESMPVSHPYAESVPMSHSYAGPVPVSMPHTESLPVPDAGPESLSVQRLRIAVAVEQQLALRL